MLCKKSKSIFNNDNLRNKFTFLIYKSTKKINPKVIEIHKIFLKEIT